MGQTPRYANCQRIAVARPSETSSRERSVAIYDSNRMRNRRLLGGAAATGNAATTKTISSFTVPAGNDLALVALGSGYGSLNSINTFGGQAFSSVGTSSDAVGVFGSLNTSIWIALPGDRGSATTADVVAN